MSAKVKSRIAIRTMVPKAIEGVKAEAAASVAKAGKSFLLVLLFGNFKVRFRALFLEFGDCELCGGGLCFISEWNELLHDVEIHTPSPKKQPRLPRIFGKELDAVPKRGKV
eukprot:698560-Amphidinium_carterae.1